MASSTVFEEHPAAPIGLALERSERQSERGRKNPSRWSWVILALQKYV